MNLGATPYVDVRFALGLHLCAYEANRFKWRYPVEIIIRMEALTMGYLVLSRKESEDIQLDIDPGVDTEKLLRNLLRGGLTIRVNSVSGAIVRIGIEAPLEVLVLRSELAEQSESR